MWPPCAGDVPRRGVRATAVRVSVGSLCRHELGGRHLPGPLGEQGHGALGEVAAVAGLPFVEPSMASDPNRHRVVPKPGDDTKNRSARCPSQPSPNTCAPRRSPSSSRCPQRRSAAGRRRACCPTSAPWAATDATPTPRSGPCWKPCPSHPRPASRAPRLTALAPLLSVASVVVRDRPLLDRDGVGPGTGDFVRARDNPGHCMTWANARKRLLTSAVN
jgi:hypothetical protein